MSRSMLLVLLALLLFAVASFAQSTNATITGRVVDPSKAVVVGASVEVINQDTNVKQSVQTNSEGIYVVPNLIPGTYRIEISKQGFKTALRPDVILHVQDVAAINFELPLGAASESVTVEGGAPLVNTQDAAVSTVVDRNFAENLPMNGRSFQTLIQLTPGVVVVPSSPGDAGQFSVNGQRAYSNYWMVDGVSANVGIGITGNATGTNNGFAGALGGFSVLGGTNSLVSVDAMEEFRIQTSTYAPEFGRTPGAQISIATRSGTNHFHGTVFDYFRNDVLDANNWFNGFTNNPPLPKARERQNDFGGTLGGPIIEDRTFFFFSYEGSRLRLPQTALSTVPDLNARQTAVAAIQPFLNAYPLPNGVDNVATGIAQFNASFSNPATLDAYSIRADQRLGNRLSLFGRYNYSPTDISQRGAGGGALSTVTVTGITTQTATVGATWAIAPTITSDLRFNYSRTEAHQSAYLDSFGGAVPATSVPFPSGFDLHNAGFGFIVNPLTAGLMRVGELGHNFQRQINLVGSTSLQARSHAIKIGADFRRLTPQIQSGAVYSVSFQFADVASFKSGSLLDTVFGALGSPTFLFRNIGLYAQDTWRATPQLSVTYGLRWDLDLVPSSSPTSFPAVTGFNLNNLSGLALAPAGIEPYGTSYGNVAPRVGIAWQLPGSRDGWQTVLHGGFGLFYDLASSELGNEFSAAFYPYGNNALIAGGAFPPSSAQLQPPAPVPPNKTNGILFAINPKLNLPYTLEWNVAMEQGIGKQQTLSMSYVGAAGRRLLQQMGVSNPNATLLRAQILTNASTSDYDALQVQFKRRLSQGLQALFSYTWAHSIDTASAGSNFGSVNGLLPSALSQDRGPSDFDIRHTFSAALTYDLPTWKVNAFSKVIFGGWSTENTINARSAPPVAVFSGSFFSLTPQLPTLVRPDLVPGQPLYLFGSQYPGGKALNPAAFANPPGSGGIPARQGTLSRNSVRGFGAAQWDFAVHRDFPVHEALRLQFRAEMFNVLNHPNFGPPRAFVGLGGFGLATQTLAQGLSGSNLGGGAFNPLYQMGGPRSIQLALKMAF